MQKLKNSAFMVMLFWSLALSAWTVPTEQLPGIYDALRNGTASVEQARTFVQAIFALKQIYRPLQGGQAFALCRRFAGSPETCAFLNSHVQEVSAWINFYDNELVARLTQPGLTGPNLTQTRAALVQAEQELEQERSAAMLLQQQLAQTRGHTTSLQQVTGERDRFQHERDRLQQELQDLQALLATIQANPNNPTRWALGTAAGALAGGAAAAFAAWYRGQQQGEVQQVNEAEAQVQRLTQELQALQQQLQQVQGQQQEAQAQVQRLQQQLQQAMQAQQEAQQQLAQVQPAVQQAAQVANDIQLITNERDTLLRRVTQADEALRVAEQSLAIKTNQHDRAVLDIQQLTQELAAARTAVQGVTISQQDIARLRADRAALVTAYTQLREANRQLQAAHDAIGQKAQQALAHG